RLYEEWRRKKTNEVSALTLQWYAETIEGKILPFWCAKRVDQFAHVDFDRFKTGLIQSKLAPRSVNIALMRLRELLRLAYDRGYLKEDRSRWVVLVRQGRPDISPLNFEEKERFLKALRLRWRPYFEVAFGTGLRPSEQIALSWDRVDLKRGKIE